MERIWDSESTASFNRFEPSRDEVTHSWRSDLATDVTDGKWIAHLTMLGIRLKKAVASGEMTEADAIVEYKDAGILGKTREACGRCHGL